MNEIQYIQKHGVKSACELIELLGGYEKGEFRHATDEEITAGRCLDQ